LMGEMEMRAAGAQLLAQARAVRAAYPDAAAMRAVLLSPRPDGGGRPQLLTALRSLWDEVVLVRDGKADGVGVLTDEIACVERELARG
jgi:hypothetical protein